MFTVSRPDALWVSHLTCMATWSGFVYAAFVIDACARRIVGWRVSVILVYPATRAGRDSPPTPH